MTRTEVLASLRNAIDQNDVNVIIANVAQLLPHITRIDASMFVAKPILRFLIDFSRVYPEDKRLDSVIRLIEWDTALETVSSQGLTIHKHLKKYWDKAGISNFRNTLKAIIDLQQFDEDSAEYNDALADIFARMVTAISAQSWGTKNSGNAALWNRWFHQETQEDFFIGVTYYAQDSEVLALTKSLWTEIANDLEGSLGHL